jgi:hypothetical protein
VDAVVERLAGGPAQPGEPRLAELGPDLRGADGGVIGPGPAQVDPEGGHQQRALRVAQLIGPDALVGQHEVVLEGAGFRASVRPVLEMGRQRSRHDRGVQDGLFPLGGVEGADQIEAASQLGREDLGSGERAGGHPAWLGAHEGRGEDHVVAEHEAVDVQVMTVELPAPGLVRRRRAEDRDEVVPLAELGRAGGEDSQQAVDPHDVARLVEPSRRQRRPDHVESEPALLRAEVAQHEPMTEHVRVGVEPGPPLLGRHRELDGERVFRPQ